MGQVRRTAIKYRIRPYTMVRERRQRAGNGGGKQYQAPYNSQGRGDGPWNGKGSRIGKTYPQRPKKTNNNFGHRDGYAADDDSSSKSNTSRRDTSGHRGSPFTNHALNLLQAHPFQGEEAASMFITSIQTLTCGLFQCLSAGMNVQQFVWTVPIPKLVWLQAKWVVRLCLLEFSCDLEGDSIMAGAEPPVDADLAGVIHGDGPLVDILQALVNLAGEKGRCWSSAEERKRRVNAIRADQLYMEMLQNSQ
ncbi:hypothetical protein B0J18DRAFT_140439 [Chaetomium sp. MPI-SDFR-AT-0129]|nr:hypothetical protein B0J18DRAFT_140439 [Chaetomium sp. MPI-SDFR-AT-0129]